MLRTFRHLEDVPMMNWYILLKLVVGQAVIITPYLQHTILNIIHGKQLIYRLLVSIRLQLKLQNHAQELQALFLIK